MSCITRRAHPVLYSCIALSKHKQHAYVIRWLEDDMLCALAVIASTCCGMAGAALVP
jgi:hypothetical protein